MAKSKGAKKPTKVLVVDDHAIVREGLELLLEKQFDLDCCGLAADTDAALQMIDAREPHVVVVDISLKNGNGLDLIKRIRARNESIRILVMSMHDESLFAERAIRAGAIGYLNKETSTPTILEAIRSVRDGKTYLSPRIAEQMAQRVRRGNEASQQSPLEHLSDRELEVYERIGHGMSTRDIADQLNLSHKTVENYRENIKTKLNLKDATELSRNSMLWVLEKR